MSARNSPPFRADHVGSLLRPASLVQAREETRAGRISAAELRAREDEAILAVVRMQEAAGLQSITDGEFRRSSWHLDFLSRISGLAESEDRMRLVFANADGKVEFNHSPIRVTGKIAPDGTIFGNDFSYLRSITERTPKISIPSPSMMHVLNPAAIDRRAYASREEFYADIAPLYAAQIAGLAQLGCTYLQLDDTRLAYLNDPAQRALIAKNGGDAEQHLRMYIDHINAAVKNRPAGMTVTTHLCRGNFRSSWGASGSYDHIAERLFSQLDVDGFFLEYDDERSGGFEPLRFIPRGKMAVLGLITSKRAAIEDKELIKRRIEEAAKFVPIEQICISPQCGFASTIEGNALTAEQQLAKLRLVVELAEEVWGR